MALDSHLHRLAADGRGLQHLAQAVLRHREDAEDAVQEAYVRALEQERAGRALSTGWVRGVVRNVSREARRARTRRQRRETEPRAIAKPQEPDELAARLEAHEALLGQLRRLPDPVRMTLVLRYLEGHSSAEIARRLSEPAATIRWRIQDGLRRLRESSLRDDERNGNRPTHALALVATGIPARAWASHLGALGMAKATLNIPILCAGALVVALALLVWRPWALTVDTTSSEHADITLVESDVPPPTLSPAPLPTPQAEPAVPRPLAHPLFADGRVIDMDRRPVAGAEVTLVGATSSALIATTDAEGRYRFTCDRMELPSYAVVSVVGRDDLGRMGVVCTRLDLDSGGARKIEPLVLRPAATVAIRVTHEGKPVSDASVAIEHERHFIAWNTFALLAQGTTDNNGVWCCPDSIGGSVRIGAHREGVGLTSTSIHIEASASRTIELALRAPRSVSVRVIDVDTGEPLPGVTLRASRSASSLVRPLYPTSPTAQSDANGEATLTGLPHAYHLYVHAAKDGWRGPMRGGTPTVGDALRATTTTLLVGMARDEPMRLPIDAASDTPPDGTVLEVHLTQKSGPVAARIEKDMLVIEGAPVDRDFGNSHQFVGTVIAPDGRWAQVVYMVGEMRELVRFQAPRSLRIRVEDADGMPVPDIDLNISPRSSGMPSVTTNQAGEVVARCLCEPKGRVSINAQEPYVMGMGDYQLLGSFDLDRDPQPLVLQMPAQCVIEARVLVNGTPQLPTSYRIVHAGHLVHWSDIEEDIETHTLRIRRPITQHTQPIQLHAPNMLSAHATADGDGGPIELALRSAASLRVHITPPSDGSYRLGLQRQDPTSRTWTRAPRVPAMHANVPDSRIHESARVSRFVRLPSGRYRVIDYRSQVASEATDIVEGEPVADVSIDLSDVIMVAGHIDAPPGTRIQPVRVFAEYDGVRRKANWHVRGPDSDGTIHVPAVRVSALRVWLEHDALVPQQKDGVRLVAGRGKPFVLTLARTGAALRFSLGAEQSKAPTTCSMYFAGSDTKAPSKRDLTSSDGLFEVSALPTDTPLHIVVDAGAPWAPLAIPVRSWEPGVHELGALTLRTGASVRVKFELPEGTSRGPHVRGVALSTINGLLIRRSVWISNCAREDLVLAGLSGQATEVRVGIRRFPDDGLSLGSGGKPKPPPPEIVRTLTLELGNEHLWKLPIPDQKANR